MGIDITKIMHRAIKSVVLVPAMSALLWLATAGSAGACPNAAIRVGPSEHLPECRAYELVSQPYKGGFAAVPEAVEQDGEAVIYYSPGAFAGVPSGGEPAASAQSMDYIAHRGGSGWKTTPLMVPSAFPDVKRRDVSSSFDLTLALVKPGPNGGATNEGTEEEMLVHPTGSAEDTLASWERVGPVLTPVNETALEIFELGYLGVSSDFCHFFVKAGVNVLLEEALEAPPLGRSSLVYELDRGCHGGAPALRLVGMNNSGKLVGPGCRTGLGNEAVLGSSSSTLNAISDDGSEVFFVPFLPGGSCSTHQVFVRLAGQRTLEVSRSLDPSKRYGGCVGEEAPHVPGEVPCTGAAARAGADFVGASEDGSRVFVETAERLVAGADVGTNNLYMATIGCPPGEPECEAAGREVTSLVDVSHGPNGEPAEVLGTVRIAADGSRVYFVARGDLLGDAEREALEVQGRAVPQAGADNLYVYDASGSLAFVADLCSEGEYSGKVQDAQCPIDLGSHNDGSLLSGAGEAQTNRCRPNQPSCEPGRYLVFSTYARLLPNDTDNANDVYRYDADTGSLERVSIGEAGNDANGNCLDGTGEERCDARLAEGTVSGTNAGQHEMGSNAISEDGSRIVFTSPEPLSLYANNGLDNAYEWHQQPSESEGTVSLISGGGGESVDKVTISTEGNDIFFETNVGLVSQDSDGNLDVYDARVNGGFPPAVEIAERCKGDACRGLLTNPAPLLIPGSVPQTSGENLPAPKKATAKKLTRAQQLARALKACAKKPKKRRAACRREARAKYAHGGRAKGWGGR